MEITLKNYTQLKQNNLSRAAIAEVFGIPEWKLKKFISANGWGAKAPTINNTAAFDEYTEESCYWAGFLAADGNVDSKGRIRLMLKYDDILHLEKFKEYLQSTHAVSSNTDTYNRCSFEFTNKDMCDMLDLNFNTVPNKSLTIKLLLSELNYLIRIIHPNEIKDHRIYDDFNDYYNFTNSIYNKINFSESTIFKLLI